jgi:hypothetical protein
MQTLSYGYVLPDTGDFGVDWFPALETNITRINGHTHDGVNSAPLSSKAIIPEKLTVLQAAFTNISPGVERTLITMPAGMTVDNTTVVVKDPTTKDTIHLKVEKFSLSQVYLFTNFLQDFEVYFLT